MIKKLFLILIILFTAVYTYISILAINNYKLESSRNSLFYIFIYMIGVVLLSILLDFLRNRFKLKSSILLLIITSVALLLRLLWLLNINTDLFSDFQGYFDYARDISIGQTHFPNHLYQLFPFTVGYPFVLSIMFKLFGASLIAGKAFNLICSLILLLLIFAVTDQIFGIRPALTASLIFAIWPAQIMYTSVMATEHIFIIFFLLSIYLAIIAIKKSGGMKYIITILLGASIILTQFIRPIGSLLMVCVIIFWFVFTEIKVKFMNSILKKLVLIVVLFLSYLMFSTLLNHYILSVTKVDLSKSSMGFNLLIGTNTKYGGVWNTEDAKIIDEYKGYPEKTQKEALRRGINRIKANPANFICFAIVKKVRNIWENNGFAYYWSTQKLVSSNKISDYVIKNSKLFNSICQIFYIFILIMGILGAIFAFRKSQYEAALPVTIILSIFGAHLFLEVQGRYAYPAFPLLIVLAGWGTSQIKDIFTNYKSK